MFAGATLEARMLILFPTLCQPIFPSMTEIPWALHSPALAPCPRGAAGFGANSRTTGKAGIIGARCWHPGRCGSAFYLNSLRVPREGVFAIIKLNVTSTVSLPERLGNGPGHWCPASAKQAIRSDQGPPPLKSLLKTSGGNSL